MAVLFKHELLAKVRVELGLTQEDAARSVGVDVRTYRRYESGEVNEGGAFALQRASRRKILDRICRELGIEEGDLLQTLVAPAQLPASLPRARHFSGRAQELARLREWLGDRASASRVLTVLAMGGAGKTSLVERALSEPPASPEASPFVHSFYDEPSVDACLSAAARYLERQGGEPLDDVLAGLLQRPASVLVLDGLELVQASGDGERARGELEDRRLARLFRAVARDARLGRLLVTSRFPLADLAAFEGAELETLSLASLDADEAQALLASWGVRGGAAALASAHAQTGGHALSLAVLGSYASELLNGDLSAAVELELTDAAREQPLARRLHAVLEKYASELLPVERRLLVCVCVFPRGASEATLLSFPEFQSQPITNLRAALGRLVHRGLVVGERERYSAHPFIREHFAARALDATGIHRQERERVAAELEGQPLHRPEGELLLDTCERLFEHTLLSGDVAGAFRVAERTLGGFAHLGLRLGEFERGLRLTRALGRVAKQLPPDVAWRIGYDHGLYAAALGDLDGAVRAYRRLLAQRDDDATTHRTLAYTLRLRGELDEAHRHVDRSIALGRRDEALGSLARGLALRGAIFCSQRRWDEAGAAFAEARELGDAPTARRAIWEAEYWLAIGDAENAVRETLQNLQQCQARGWAGHVAHCHVILGRAAVGRGLLDDADDALDAALDWCRRSREVELTLEAKLLDLQIAEVRADAARARQTRSELLDAALAGGFGLVRAAVQVA